MRVLSSLYAVSEMPSKRLLIPRQLTESSHHDLADGWPVHDLFGSTPQHFSIFVASFCEADADLNDKNRMCEMARSTSLLIRLHHDVYQYKLSTSTLDQLRPRYAHHQQFRERELNGV